MVAAIFLRRHWLIALSIAFFVLCLLFQTVYYAAFPVNRSIGSGWSALVAGWLGLLEGIPAWLANPLLLAAWIAYGRKLRQLSLMLSIAAAGLMLSFALVTEIEVGTSGSPKTITSYGLGYYLWVSSAITQVFASWPSQKARNVSPN